MVNADGNGASNLTNTTHLGGEFASGPRLSPAGTQIAFSGELDRMVGVFVMSADGSNLMRLTADLAGGVRWQPEPAP